MFKNYLLVAWRTIRKHKAFTFINVIGLALSMSVCLLLILLIYDHYAYDDFHPNRDHIYRVVTSKKGEQGFLNPIYATSPLPIGKKVASEYTLVDNYTNLSNGVPSEIRSQYKIIHAESEILSRSLFADEQFFNIFGFELKEGHQELALKDPRSVVLTSDLAGLLFPKGDILGSMVELGDYGSFKVTGVLQDPPGKSHIRFKLLASFSTLPLLHKEGKLSEEYKSWESIWMNYNYLVLRDPSDQAEVEQLINSMANANIELEDDHPGYEFQLEAIDDIVPGEIHNNEISFTLPRIFLFFFAALALLVMITASINYANLSVAMSLARTKEIGIRKANGAGKKQIVIQFLTESVIISIISLVLAVLIYWPLIDRFNELWIFNLVGIKLQDTHYAYLIFLIFSVFMGLVCGLAPALFMAKMDTIRSLKGNVKAFPLRKKGWAPRFSGKKTLLSFQFGIAIIMLVSIFLLRDQANHLTAANFGFNDEKTFFISLQDHDPQLIKNEFAQLPGIENIAFTSHHPAVGRMYGVNVQLSPDQEPFNFSYFSVDDSYVAVMGLVLIAGSNFPSSTTDDQEKFIILNEKAVERLEYESPSDAIGNMLILEDDRRVQIVGVVKDYHWEPLMKSIQPMMLRWRPKDYQYAYFDISGNEPPEIRQQIEAKWQAFDPARDVKGGFLNEEVDLFYQFLFDISDILTFVSLIAISITGLGFLGMVSFHLKTRVKEIGIRKVMGASFVEVMLSMTKGFIWMLTITSLITVPIAVILNGLWIHQMAIHAPIGIMNVGPAVLIIVAIGAVTLCTQVWMSTSNDPIKSLRNE